MLGFELRAYTLSHSAVPFFCVMDFFKIGSRKLLCPGWLQTKILLLSVSWVARVTGMSHRCLAKCILIRKLSHENYLLSWIWTASEMSHLLILSHQWLNCSMNFRGNSQTTTLCSLTNSPILQHRRFNLFRVPPLPPAGDGGWVSNTEVGCNGAMCKLETSLTVYSYIHLPS
jgi:hypothetical protein